MKGSMHEKIGPWPPNPLSLKTLVCDPPPSPPHPRGIGVLLLVVCSTNTSFCKEESNFVNTKDQQKQCDNCCQENQTWSAQAAW